MYLNNNSYLRARWNSAENNPLRQINGSDSTSSYYFSMGELRRKVGEYSAEKHGRTHFYTCSGFAPVDLWTFHCELHISFRAELSMLVSVLTVHLKRKFPRVYLCSGANRLFHCNELEWILQENATTLSTRRGKNYIS